MSGDGAVANGGGAGTSGRSGVTSGVPALAFALCVAGLIAFAAINVWTRLHDQPELIAAGRTWEVVCWEATSALASLLLLPGIAWVTAAALRALPDVRKAIALHAAGTAGFFVLHVGLFVGMRAAVYAAMGSRYRFGGAEAWLYEFPKDVLSYGILAAMMTGLSLRARRAPVHKPERRLIEIREGARTWYVRPEDILAVSAAGNYVEWHLGDGRKPLTRASLGAMERQLAPLGFVRTHRSWLVNRAHVTAVEATPSGERQLTLAGRVVAPASRRYAQALDLR